MATPNMNLVLPTVGVTLDPTWASNLNTALALIDSHDHSSGEGVLVPTAGLNINADLSFQSNDATNLRSLSLNNNISTLPTGDIRAIYATGGNLYYNNNSGTAIQITTGSSLNTGALALNVWELTELAGNLTITGPDSFVYINTDTSSSRSIILPAASAVTAGRYYIIKDKTGQAATNTISITPAGFDTIDGVASSISVSAAYGSITLVSDGVSGWLTNAAISGFVQLGGDLLGTGTSTINPRVSSLTGISGLVTMANNTALNTRNAANDTNVNLTKVDGSNFVRFGDAAFSTVVNGSNIIFAPATGSMTASVPGVVSFSSDSIVTLAGASTATLSSSAAGVVVDGYTSVAITAGSGAMTLTAGTNLNATASDNVAITANNGSVTTTAFTSIASTATTTNTITAGTALTLVGQIVLPTKAVTSSPYTVDTTTKDYVIFVDPTSGAVSINLPAASNGRKLIIQDVAGLANTNNITLVRNGSDQIQGVGANYVMDADFQGVTLIGYSGGSWFIIGT